MNDKVQRFAARPAALAAALALAMHGAWADPPARVGRIAWLAGDVSLSAQPGAAPAGAVLNWPVTTGNVLVTGPSGRAEVTIGSTALDLDVGTEVDVEQLDDAQMRLRVTRGSLAVRTANAQDAAMTVVQTPQGRFGEQQPGSFRVDVRDATVDGTAWRGNVSFTADGGAAYTFTEGQRARFAPGGNGVAMSLLGAPADDFQRFAQARAGQRPPAPAGRYVSAEMTGAEALDAYGQWTNSPDYGAVWVPRVAADWAPYRYGHWAWVSPWGWTWIDDQPWGFAPFHYGRWALWQGGWAWVPGTYAARPVYAPALVAWTGPMPAAPGVSVSVSIGASVGWVPLAPREVYVPPYAVSNTYVRNVNITHVTNVTEIENVTRIVHQQGGATVPATGTIAGRSLALAGNPRAVTTMQAQAMQTHQPVMAHLAAPLPVAAAVPAPVRRADPHPAPQPGPQGAPRPPRPPMQAQAVDTSRPPVAQPQAEHRPPAAPQAEPHQPAPPRVQARPEPAVRERHVQAPRPEEPVRGHAPEHEHERREHGQEAR
jgi:hypothetical protein